MNNENPAVTPSDEVTAAESNSYGSEYLDERTNPYRRPNRSGEWTRRFHPPTFLKDAARALDIIAHELTELKGDESDAIRASLPRSIVKEWTGETFIDLRNVTELVVVVHTINGVLREAAENLEGGSD